MTRLIVGLILAACSTATIAEEVPQPFLIVLGIAQDGGVPQIGRHDDPAWQDQSGARLPTSLGLVDPTSGQRWLFEATPAIKPQLYRLNQAWPRDDAPGLDGIFITHAHIGHYTGLMFLGHEAMGAQGVPVYAMPRLAAFLSGNGPWDQLLRYGNIKLMPLQADQAVSLNRRLQVTPLPVPHRQEYADTVAFVIQGPNRRALFIPDIDAWEPWEAAGYRLEDQLQQVDMAFIDGTFYADGEVPGRDMSTFPHPRISDTMQRLQPLKLSERGKVRFIHFNHTNPAVRLGSEAQATIRARGFDLAEAGQRYPL